MKKTFVFLWCALVGCSIIPDDSFEEIPDLESLKKVTITSNVRGGALSEKLVASVSYNGPKMIVDFAGDLDPFHFTGGVEKIEYEYNAQKLVSGITLFFDNNTTRVEKFSYNEAGDLDFAVLKQGVFKDSLQFYYTINNQLDSIAKFAFEGSALNAKGFYARIDPVADDVEHRFYAVFPFDEAQSVPNTYAQTCNQTYFQNDNDAHMSYYSFPEGNFSEEMEHAINVPGTDLPWKTEHERTLYNTVSYTFFGYPKYVESYIYQPSTYFSDGLCHGLHPGLSYYRLIPEPNMNYTILSMIALDESRYYANLQPNRMDPMYSFKAEFDYNFTESE